MADVKPDIKPKIKQLNIKVQDWNGEEIYFKVKSTTKMSKIFAAYAQQKNLQVSALKFLFDGTILHGDNTPSSLEMEDDDMIVVMQTQLGGSL